VDSLITMETPATDRTKRQTPHEFSKKLIKLTVAGDVAFWIVDFAMSLSPISAEYMAAFSISSLPMALVEALVGGLIIACFVSYFLLRFFDKIPTKHPIPKALILSFVAVVIIEVLSTFSNPSNAYVYLLIDTVMNIPRILALGIVIGYLYKRLYGYTT
jgi:CBS-domain-containing membrane protein